MTIQQYRYVLEIAKRGSISEAAKQLFVAQSSLSTSIKMLETELNIKIFERSGGGVYLTEEGAEFVRYASQIVDGEDLLIDRYRGAPEARRLRIATQHYDFIADVFGGFVAQQTAPSYRFSIKEIETYNVIQEVERGLSDIGILAIKDSDLDVMRRYLGKRGISFHELLFVRPHVFFRKEHPLAEREVLEYAALSQYPYVSYEQGDHNSSYFTEELAEPSYAEKQIEISDRATLMNLLLLTDAYTVGTGIMPSRLGGGIVSVPLLCEERYVIGYILNDERRLSGMSSEFIEKLKLTLENIVANKGADQ